MIGKDKSGAGCELKESICSMESIDEGAFQERRMKNEDVARVLRISMRKIDRVKIEKIT